MVLSPGPVSDPTAGLELERKAMLEACRAAARPIRLSWTVGGPEERRHKGEVDLVTEIDRAAEQAVVARIYPHELADADALSRCEQARDDCRVSRGRAAEGCEG